MKLNDYRIHLFTVIYFGILILNYFLHFPISKIFYYIPFVILSLHSIWYLYRFETNKLTLNKYFIFLIFIFVFYILFPFEVVDQNAHVIYLLIFLVNIFSVYFTFKSKINISHFNLKIFTNILKYSIFFNLLLTDIDIFLNINLNTRGWIWPTNIALQEIVLINLLYSQIILIGLKKTTLNILLFLIMVLFRESGKAAFFSFGIFILLYPFYKYNIGKYVQKRLIHIVVFVNFFVLLFGTYFMNINNILIDSNSYSYLAYVFNKRFTMITDALSAIGNVKYFFTGFGFGFENYINANFTKYSNTPQFLILTLTVYGGFIFTLIFFMTYFKVLKSFLKLVINNQRLTYIVFAYFFTMIFMLSFHEYFSNPLIYLSTTIFIYSIKIKIFNV
jgi:hypothetical protein